MSFGLGLGERSSGGSTVGSRVIGSGVGMPWFSHDGVELGTRIREGDVVGRRLGLRFVGRLVGSEEGNSGLFVGDSCVLGGSDSGTDGLEDGTPAAGIDGRPVGFAVRTGDLLGRVGLGGP